MLLTWWWGEAIVTVRPAGRRSPARWSTEDSPGSTLDQLVADVADDRRSDRVVDAELGNVPGKRVGAGEVTPTQARTAVQAA